MKWILTLGFDVIRLFLPAGRLNAGISLFLFVKG